MRKLIIYPDPGLALVSLIMLMHDMTWMGSLWKGQHDISQGHVNTQYACPGIEQYILYNITGQYSLSWSNHITATFVQICDQVKRLELEIDNTS